MGIEKYLRRLSSSFTAPKLNIGYDASQRFCFAPVISLKNLNDCEDDRRAEWQARTQSSQTREQIVDRT